MALRALAQIASIDFEEISNYNYLLGPLVSQYVTEEKHRNEVLLLRAALLCFPRVRHPSEVRERIPKYFEFNLTTRFNLFFLCGNTVLILIIRNK